MNFRVTWTLLIAAVVLFAFIYGVERPWRHAREHREVAKPLLNGFDEKAFTGIELLRDRQAIRLERTNDKWNLIEPVRYPAHQERIVRLLESLAALPRRRVLSETDQILRPQAAGEFGISPPRSSLILTQQGRRLEFHFGNKSLNGRDVYIQLVGTTGIFLASGSLADQLPETADDWRDPTFLDLAGVSFNRLETRAGGYSFELQRNSTNQLWELSKPKPAARADSSRANYLIEQLSNAQIIKFVPPRQALDLEAVGLQPPELEVAIGQGTNDLAVGQFGKPAPENPSLVFARRGGTTNVVLLPKELVSLFRVPSTELRDRHLMSLSPETIDRIEVAVDGSDSFALRRESTNNWRILAPYNFAADPELVQTMLTGLADLEILKFVKDIVTDFSSYGLSTPVRSFALFQRGPGNDTQTNVLAARVDFGNTPQRDTIYARRIDEDSVYEVGGAQFEELPKAPYQLRDRRLWNFPPANVISVTFTLKGQTRKLLRSAKGEWSVAPVYQGEINPFAPEVTMQQLSQLKAEHWIGQGAQTAGSFGIKRDGDQITIELNSNSTTSSYQVLLGRLGPSRSPYASIILDGQTVVFEFPTALYSSILRDFAGVATPSSPL